MIFLSTTLGGIIELVFWVGFSVAIVMYATKRQKSMKTEDFEKRDN